MKGLEKIASQVALAVALSSCGGGSVDPGRAVDDAVGTVPAEIQHLMNSKFPADGKIHVESRGRIVITPRTSVCYFPDGFSIQGRPLFEALGQPTKNEAGSSRQQPAVKGRCDFTADGVLINGRQLPNRISKPYKLVLAVWQGNRTYWVGSIERYQGIYPEALEMQLPILNGVSYGDEAERASVLQAFRENVSLEKDTSALQERVIQYLVGSEMQKWQKSH